MKVDTKLITFLNNKAKLTREETLKIHKIAPQTRLASSLSAVEIFVVLYYGGILKFKPKTPDWVNRDRFIVSKGHGAISLYPILADFGFFQRKELENVCRDGSCFGSIPDSLIPGFETINGSLGHGLGVGCGVALALKNKKIGAKVFVLTGDGELYEGANWEAVMFSAHHRLDNLVLIVDNNKISMLDYCKNIIDLEPLEDKFRAFNWKVQTINGHNFRQLYLSLKKLKQDRSSYPKVLIANTKKGKGVPQLENDALCHIKPLNEKDIDSIIKNLK